MWEAGERGGQRSPNNDMQTTCQLTSLGASGAGLCDGFVLSKLGKTALLGYSRRVVRRRVFARVVKGGASVLELLTAL